MHRSDLRNAVSDHQWALVIGMVRVRDAAIARTINDPAQAGLRAIGPNTYWIVIATVGTHAATTPPVLLLFRLLLADANVPPPHPNPVRLL